MDFRGKRTAGLPLLAGLVNGALAYVSGLVGAFVVYVVFGLNPLFEIALSASSLPFASGVGFAFYGGHFVPVRFEDGSTLNFALDVAASGVLYVLLVAVILTATGYYLGSAGGIRTPSAGAAAGATLVLGYLPLAALGATAFDVSRTTTTSFGQSQTLSMEIPIVRAVLLAGVIVPVAAGALGGALAARSDE